MPITRPGRVSKTSTPSIAATAAMKSGRAAMPSCLARATTTRRSRRSAAMSTSSMHGRDDDGGERRLGQLLEQAGEEEQGHDRQRGHDQPGHLALGTGAAVDGGLREAAVDHHPARQARTEVCGPEAEQLGVGVDLVVMPGGVGLGRPQALRKADQHDADRAAGKLQVLLARMSGSPSDGRPPSMFPTIATPCSSRSNA